ncbi:MAG TPA: GGDEF domain-containing protein, partial [Pseudolabrys sp.]|nr:GGDEF domain-containing protein [Pseudolabrys sp.]
MIAGAPALSLDVPTLAFVSIALAGLLGVFLVISWVQDRNVPSLAWWGSAYLIGASSVALWLAPAPRFHIPPEVPEAMTLLACGVVWSGIRLFHGRVLKPLAAFAGAIAWPVLCDLPGVAAGSDARIGLGAVLVAAYTFVIAFELWRERRKSLFSRAAAIVVPSLHAAIFLMPVVMQAFMPRRVAAAWLTVFALEAMIYAVGTAFIMMLMVKDRHVYVYRRAATTDHLTGLPNRRAFLQDAATLCASQVRKRQPVTLMMFDLDHFKSINDRFGHAIGDEALKVFAQVLGTSMRASDIMGRLGGEEFAVIVAGNMETTARIAERIRAGFEMAGRIIADLPVGGTVSIGAATAAEAVVDIDALLARADEALYEAKRSGRNRLCAAPDVACELAVLPEAAAQRRTPAARQISATPAASL